jgi:eukaryotic-like serine/threonine-protein kinase
VRAAPDEFPAHDVTLEAYWMDQLEVTNAMYQSCVRRGAAARLPQNLGSRRRKSDYFYTILGFKDYPVVYVTWGQAKSLLRMGRPASARPKRNGNAPRAAATCAPSPGARTNPITASPTFNFMLATDTSRVGSYPLGASPFGILGHGGQRRRMDERFFYRRNYYSKAAELDESALGPLTSSNF